MTVSAEILRSHDLRPTPARERILDLLTADAQAEDGGSITPETLHRRLVEGGFRPSLPSVYRVLFELTEAGLIERFRPLPGASVFALKRREHVVHLLCTRCRAVEAVDDTHVDRRIRAIGKARGFAVERVGWSLQGLCRACASP